MSTFKARVLYDFQGEPNTAEMSITAGELLTVTRTDVGDGWWEGLNPKWVSGGALMQPPNWHWPPGASQASSRRPMWKKWRLHPSPPIYRLQPRRVSQDGAFLAPKSPIKGGTMMMIGTNGTTIIRTKAHHTAITRQKLRATLKVCRFYGVSCGACVLFSCSNSKGTKWHSKGNGFLRICFRTKPQLH